MLEDGTGVAVVGDGKLECLVVPAVERVIQIPKADPFLTGDRAVIIKAQVND
jgi:hypothetical protein